MLVNNPQKYLADRKMLLMSPSFIFGTFGRNKKKKKDSSDWIGAYLTHRVMDTREMRGHESMREMCFCKNNGSFTRAVCVKLWVILEGGCPQNYRAFNYRKCSTVSKN